MFFKVRTMTFRRKRERMPPDRGKRKKRKKKGWPKKEREGANVQNLKYSKELNAAQAQINRINHISADRQKLCDEFRIMNIKIIVCEKLISDQIASFNPILKMSDCMSSSSVDKCVEAEASIVFSSSAANNNDTLPLKENKKNGTPSRKPQKTLHCYVPGCVFSCKWLRKLKEHIVDIHGSDSLDSTMFSEGLSSPGKTSTQGPHPLAKRKFESVDSGTVEPEPTKKKLDEKEFNNITINETCDENELTKAAEEAEMTHDMLLQQVKMKAEALKLVENAAERLSGTAENTSSGPLVTERDPDQSSQHVSNFIWSDSGVPTQKEAEIELEESVPEDTFVSMDNNSMSQTLLGSPKMTVASEMDSLLSQVESLQKLLAHSKSSETELENRCAGQGFKIEKLKQDLEEARAANRNLKDAADANANKVKELRAMNKEINAKNQNLEKQAKEWKVLGEQFMLKDVAKEEAEISKMKKEMAAMAKKIENLTIAKNRAEESAKANRELSHMTNEAYTMEKGNHARTKKQIPCSNPDCEGGKTCEYGHGKASAAAKAAAGSGRKKINKKCKYFNIWTGLGCNKEDCLFIHDTTKVGARKKVSNNSSSSASVSEVSKRDMFEETKEDAEKMDVDVVVEDQQQKKKEEVKVIGAKTATLAGDRLEDYKSCEVYQKRYLEASKVNQPSQKTPNGAEPRSAAVPVTPTLTIPPKSPVLPSPTPSPTPVPQPPTPTSVNNSNLNPMTGAGFMVSQRAPGVSGESLPKINIQSPNTVNLQHSLGVTPLPNRQLQAVRDYDSMGGGVSPSYMSQEMFSEAPMVRLPTPEVVERMGMTDQDLSRAGLNSMPRGGVLVGPMSSNYPAMVDDQAIHNFVKKERRRFDQNQRVQQMHQHHVQLQPYHQAQVQAELARVQAVQVTRAAEEAAVSCQNFNQPRSRPTLEMMAQQLREAQMQEEEELAERLALVQSYGMFKY